MISKRLAIDKCPIGVHGTLQATFQPRFSILAFFVITAAIALLVPLIFKYWRQLTQEFSIAWTVAWSVQFAAVGGKFTTHAVHAVGFSKIWPAMLVVFASLVLSWCIGETLPIDWLDYVQFEESKDILMLPLIPLAFMACTIAILAAFTNVLEAIRR